MSSSYSSLEEDAKDFFTARTSFFRRAPQGKSRTGQQDVEKEKETHNYLSKEEIKEKLQKYNLAVTDKLKMALNSNEIYTGFIKVQMAPTKGKKGKEKMMRNGKNGNKVFVNREGAKNRTDTLSFVLREHEIGEWEAFSLPELQNFLRILDKEEVEQLQKLKRRYTAYRHKLEEALGEAWKPS
ncbi:Ras association domain-containing protein 3 [Heterocephalus glaber]|uniref:Ras association domain-containing protein 3 n=1 Tax=Heterocephalus glaber TaxID=10181 RepID=G5B0X2_HETGA|nr:Ras association domain-containing protein 3 [Heterocephalus glaber]